MKWYQTLWTFGLMFWLRQGCRVGVHISFDAAFEGECACKDQELFFAKREAKGRLDSLPEWSP